MAVDTHTYITVPGPFARPPFKPIVRQFTLVPNMQPAVVGNYSFQMRSTHPERDRSQHKIEVTLTRLESGQDHCRVSWEHKKAGVPAPHQQVIFKTLLDPRRAASPYGPILHTHGNYDLAAPWVTAGKRKPRQGNHFYIDVLPTYRVGPDPVAEDAEEIRKLAAAFSDGLRAIAARSA